MRKVIFLGGAALGAMVATPAIAKDAPQKPASDSQAAADQQTQTKQDTADQPGSEIIVTGTRAIGRTQLDSISPVDVLSAQALSNQGTTEAAAALANVAPSIDFPRPSVTDATDSIRPATLRGLSPDQTLVLVNGVRAHPSALLNINSSVGRGSAAVDLNTVPTAALESIEVLRDGASALYGSDAIAGVVNLRLRDKQTGGGASLTYGGYVTHVPAPLDPRNVTDGKTATVSVWQNLPIGQNGFLDLTGEYVNREPTSRGDLDPRWPVPQLKSRFGDPFVRQYTGYANFGVPISDDGWQFVGWGGYQYRRSESAAFPRNPGNTNNVPSIYPDGFLPLIQVKSRDFSTTFGVKGPIGMWDASVTGSYGKNTLDYATIHTLNASYGSASRTDFYDGAAAYDQFVGNADISRDYVISDASDVTVAAGIEYRREGYQISAGDHDSYDHGPVYISPTNGGSVSAGAQGFGGFSPANAVDVHRNNLSGYLDLEGRFSRLSVGVAGRLEHYSDFGTTANGKLSARFDFTPSFALRGGIQTGFRAPSLQQEYFTSIASVITNGNVILTGTFPSVSGVAMALGGEQLQPELSTNYSAGAVFQSGSFNLTVDWYQIEVRNGLALSENISSGFSTAVSNLLAPYGVASARFFLNGVRTRTEGVDVVANYRLDTDGAGTFNFTLAGNYNDVSVLSVPVTTSTLNPAPTLVSRQRIVSMEAGTPPTKVTGTIDWSMGPAGVTVRGTYYGDVNQAGGSAASDLHTGEHLLTDIEARYTVADRVHLGVGVDNIFDVYPDAAPAGFAAGVVAFPFYSPFGFNGRRLYAKVGVDW